MNWVLHSALLLSIFCVCICTLNTKPSEDALPYSYQTPTWNRIFQEIEENKHYLPITYSTNTNIELGKIDTQCLLCNVLVGALLMERGFSMTNVQLSAEVQYFCPLISKQDDRVCEGLIDLNVESLGYIVDNQKNISSQKICSLLMGCQGHPGDFEWTIDIPERSTVTKKHSTGEKTFKIAHITDIHYDPKYTEGKVLDCGEPLCCQDDQRNANGEEASCGYWSSFHDADSSLRLIEATLDRMIQEDFDWVYFTGDMVSHRVWNTSPEFNKKSISDIIDLFAKKLGKPVYPILGNHETNPVNVYAPLNITDEGLSTQWLFDTAFDKWSQWLGTDVQETVKKGGYYTVSPTKGFRIIVLNNNVCQTENWWNLYDDYDPYGQLQWLVKTLKKAEDDSEIVHILLHIPNSSCLKVWGREYNKIIERFSNTIAVQFNGHTHRDQFKIYYDSQNNPNNVVINGGSLMPDKANPNFKIYTVDSSGYDVMDSELYTFDLEKANADKKINWIKLYSFQQEFGVKNLTPTELHALVKTMNEDIKNKNYTLIEKYHRFYFRDSVTAKDCDEDCRKKYPCEIVTTVHGDTSHCV